MHLLIDSDSLCYKAGFVCNEPGQQALANHQLDVLIDIMLDTTKADTHHLFLSGSRNFRYDIYPQYKGNRVDMKRPIHLQSMREYLVSEWKATVSDGIEADDAVGIAAYADPEALIAHIDKDLDCLEGQHYNYNKYEFYTLSDQEAMANFYIQLIQGDKGDNIPGYDGKMRPKLPQFLHPVVDKIRYASCAEEMFDIVLGMYQEDVVKMDLSARLLWLQRKPDDEWTEWLDKNIMEELGRLDDLTALLQARSAPPVDDGLLNSNA